MNQIAKRAPSGNAVVVPSGDLGPQPDFAWLPLDRLVVDERYQRRITSEGRVLINRIVREFEWARFQPLIVSGPDASGDYPVIDGQHRLEACRLHPLVDSAPCWIVGAPRIADQATAFVSVNKHRVGVTRVNVFWAQLAAGDPDARWVKGVCERAGVAIGRVGTGAQPPLTTIALAAILRFKPADDIVVRALRIIAAAQPEADNAFRSAAVTAVGRMVGTHGDQIDDGRLIDAIADMDLDDQIEKARLYRKTFGGNVEAALQVILTRAYNKRLRRDGNRLPEPGAGA